jgi:heme-degrading monooxygenase HmoA
VGKRQLVNQSGFSRLELLHPETDDDYLLLAYWDSESASNRWTTTNDVEAAHDELFGAIFLGPDAVDRDESATTIEAP